MKRIEVDARTNWVATVEELGLVYHHTNHPDGSRRPYWYESAAYSFTMSEIEELERATNELHQMSLAAAEHVITNGMYAELGIPLQAVPAIEATWEAEPPSVYGRFDLSYDGTGPAKLLEYNADTPTGLLEAAVIQWNWLEATFADKDQWNSIHERLIAHWRQIEPFVNGQRLYFAHSAADTSGEDLMNTAYLRETATQAGMDTVGIAIEDLGWDREQQRFVDLDDRLIGTIFKLYPWEWILEEPFAQNVLVSMGVTEWIEPVWKLLLSNKGLLPVLWQLYPDHPNLLPAYFDTPRDLSQYAAKPLFGREGANVRLHTGTGSDLDMPGPYGEGRYVYQALAPLPRFADEAYPVLGTWMIDQEAAGMGIRESRTLVTDNLSRFVPHLIDG